MWVFVMILSVITLSGCSTLPERYKTYKGNDPLSSGDSILSYCKAIDRDTEKHTGISMSSLAFSQCLTSATQTTEAVALLKSISPLSSVCGSCFSDYDSGKICLNYELKYDLF